jgi:hypothetical protein
MGVLWIFRDAAIVLGKGEVDDDGIDVLHTGAGTRVGRRVDGGPSDADVNPDNSVWSLVVVTLFLFMSFGRVEDRCARGICWRYRLNLKPNMVGRKRWQCSGSQALHVTFMLM